MKELFTWGAVLFLLWQCSKNFDESFDECKEFSDYTCSELKESKYNVYFDFDLDSDDDELEYLGQADGLDVCQSIASSYSSYKNIPWNHRQYICCLVTDKSSCQEKHRAGDIPN
jgi:hypothetical protein